MTSVELLPIHSFVNDSHLLERGLTNYWGYNTIGFFAPDPRYRAEREQRCANSRRWSAAFHEAGLEVILDVVYNHTAEGNERGPTLSFKGIDNASYYRLLPDEKRYYINDTGTGNTLNLSHPRVLQMVTDSLRYWVTEMKVDGFRFDLGDHSRRASRTASTTERLPRRLPPGPGAVEREADRRALGLRSGRLSGRRLSAGLGGVERQVPRHRARVLEGRRGRRGEWRRGSARSGDMFNHRGRRPWASVNFIDRKKSKGWGTEQLWWTIRSGWLKFFCYPRSQNRGPGAPGAVKHS